MIKQIEKLTEQEKEFLFKAPILLSVLAASGDHEINKKQKADAVKFIHLKTFTASPLLIPYYKEVEKKFNKYFNEAVKKYAPFDDVKRQALKAEINIIDTIIQKLEKNFARALHKSLTNYADHVRRSGESIIEGFIFPVPINGLTY